MYIWCQCKQEYFIYNIVDICVLQYVSIFFFFIILTRGKSFNERFFYKYCAALERLTKYKKIKIKKIQFLVYLFDIYKIIIQVTQMRKMFKKLSHNFRLTIKTDFFLSRFYICFVLWQTNINKYIKNHSNKCVSIFCCA